MSWFGTTDLRDPGLPWVAIHTRVRSEKRVAAVLTHFGVSAWAPTVPVRRRWSDRWKVVEWPLFPGYVFAQVPSDHWYPLLDIQGVYTVVKQGRLAAEIAPQALENVRAFAARLTGVPAEPERVPWYVVGDEVEVRDGPFAGLRAQVTRADGQQRVAIGLTLLGQGVSVTLPVESLLRISA